MNSCKGWRQWGGRAYLLMLAIVVFGVVRTAWADDWESYQHDPQHTGLSAVGPNPTTLQYSWQAPTGFSSPLIVGNTVYGLQNGGGTNTPTQVASFNLATGQENWDVSGDYTFPSQEAYGGGYVVFDGPSPSTGDGYLHVLNATTGATLYTVPIPEGTLSNITVATAPSGSGTVAYVADGGQVSAVSLGSSSGSVLWTANGGFSESIPTVMGNSLLLESPEQYYAINRTTGAVNHFYDGPGDGGGGTAPVADLNRNQFYIKDLYNSGTVTLTAYSNVNGTITKLWQDTGTGIGSGSVAIGPDGDIYSADNNTLVQISPVNGQILQSVSGQFANDNAPLVSDGYVWEYGPGGYGVPNDTVAYSLNNLALVAEIPGTRGDSNSQYQGIGALDDDHLIIDYGNVYDQPGFEVYQGTPAPEPTSLATLSIAVGLLLRRRRNKNLVGCYYRRGGVDGKYV